MKVFGQVARIMLLAALATGLAAAQQPAPQPGAFSVAVLNFDAKRIEESLGEDIPNLLTVFLSDDESLTLVERAEIKQILEELALGASGTVKADEAARIGMLTGAKFLVTGRVFPVGEKLYITVKIMNTETGKVKAAMAKGDAGEDVDVLVMDLAEKVKEIFATHGMAMMPEERPKADVIAELKASMADRDLPVFAVKISEQHMRRPIPDPAAETEVTVLLKAIEAPVLDAGEKIKGDWAALVKEGNAPDALAGADIAILGEGFSEYAGANDRLISVKARVEIKAVSIRSGKVLAVGRANAAEVDLAESIAAKNALQAAAFDIGVRLIPQAVAAYEKEQAAE